MAYLTLDSHASIRVSIIFGKQSLMQIDHKKYKEKKKITFLQQTWIFDDGNQSESELEWNDKIISHDGHTSIATWVQPIWPRRSFHAILLFIINVYGSCWNHIGTKYRMLKQKINILQMCMKFDGTTSKQVVHQRTTPEYITFYVG